jgi:curved DNA-binding protein CbpA
MASSATTNDYYEALGVNQNATLELITSSYRRLALKQHPDRGGSTQAFQLLALAYETLKDVDTRRKYDRIYPFVVRSRTSKPRTAPASASQSSTGSDESDAARIAVLRNKNEVLRRRAKAERETLKLSILRSRRNIRVLKQEIKDLSGIAATQAAPEVHMKSSTTCHPASHHGQDHEKARERIPDQAVDTKIDEKEQLLDLCEQLLEWEKETLHYSKLAGDDFETFMNEREIRDIEARMGERKAQE